MKILITSDNHLGYKERDAILGNDSYNTFEEILLQANIRNVDMILQGGDLFHDNRPSRSCISRTISLLKKYCTGSNTISFTCLSKMNFDDPNLNISIPFLSIHGNHDDPSGIFSTSPMHILESTNFINYIGKFNTIDEIELKPLIFYKNNQPIAIYSLGHLKDRRLYNLFLNKKIKFVKPEMKCFNILVVHQNRIEYNKKDFLPHEFLPDFFDLVIYGHEHESILLKLDSFILLQCGSSVRTSLSQKEMYDKFFYILDTEEGTLERLESKTVRRFLIDKLENVEYEEEVIKKINFLIQKSKSESKFYASEDEFKEVFCQKLFNNDFICDEENNKKIKNKEMHKNVILRKSLIEKFKVRLNELQTKILLPLIRLRISTKNSYTINKNKIRLLFKDLIANPNELLLIKKITSEIKKESIYEKKEEMSNILKNNLKFKALNEDGFINALNDFVNKDDKNAFSVFVNQSLNKLVNKMVQSTYYDFPRRLNDVKYEIELEEKLENKN